MTKRSYYSSNIQSFLSKDNYSIFGEITTNDQFSAEDLPKNTWNKEIEILKRELSHFPDGHVIFEYTISRIGNRIDNVVIYKGIIFLLEFKVGENKYPSYAIEQVTDYAFDLSCFHKESHNRLLAPILICTKASSLKQEIKISKDNVLETICCNEYKIAKYITKISSIFDIQGLELDWTIVCWDADFRFEENNFKYYKFTGAKWQNIKSEDNTLYLKNAYRVLLTRARQGFIIFVPTGDENDITAKPEYYNGIYKYLKSIGIEELL